MTFTSIQTNRRRLADEVYDQIVNAIASLEIGPNDRLVQEKLAKQLDISRTPVREALMRLEQEGVLVVSQRGGFRLHRMDDHEVRELYQSRAAVEGQAARILAENVDPETIKSLRQTIKTEEDIKVTTTRAYFEANRNIHRRFIELTDNRYLLEMFDMTWGKAMAFQLFSTFVNVDISKSLGDHMSLVEAIESGDKTVALEAVIDHIHDGLDLQLKGLHAS